MLLKNFLVNFIEENIKSFEEDDVVNFISVFLNEYEMEKVIFIPVGKNNCTIVRIEDILHVNIQKKNHIEIVTVDSKYNFLDDGSLIDKIQTVGNDFKYVNNGIIINLDKIRMYDSYFNRVYFTQDIYINVTYAAINNIIKKRLDKSKDLNENTSMEYFPLKIR